jgi:hypothetical protein
MTDFKMITYLKTITIPELFLNLPKEVQNLVFECNIDHRSQMKNVLDELVNNIFCVNCDGIISPSLMYHVDCCSSTCMYQLRDDPYYIHNIYF